LCFFSFFRLEKKKTTIADGHCLLLSFFCLCLKRRK
jgi:hypothetical protein